MQTRALDRKFDMMKRAIVIGLIALITSFIWRDVMVYSIFKIQQYDISQNQCINRNKPITQCNGTCVLNERLAQPLKEGSSNDSESILPEVKLELYMDEIDELIVHYFEQKSQLDCVNYKELKGYLPSQIKPPETV